MASSVRSSARRWENASPQTSWTRPSEEDPPADRHPLRSSRAASEKDPTPRLPRTVIEMAKDLPTGRVRRAAKVGRLAGGQTARAYATKAANLGRSKDGRRAAAERRQIEAAEQIFEVLGQMKGAAMKVGQVASFIDTGAFPPEFQERFQAKLAELRDSAPRVPFERDAQGGRGRPRAGRSTRSSPSSSEEAVAAASIGQVYRARLHDGRRVAVKVQYPGVAQAVRADLQNLGPDPARGQAHGPRHGREGDGARRSASASPRSSTTSTRPRTTAPSRARGADTRSST